MAQPHSTQVRVKIVARPSTVYRFLSDPAYFANWMGQGSSISAKPGGSLTVKYPNGDVARGEVVEVTPNRRISFTYGYELPNRPPPGSTRITVELQEIESGTLTTLTHEALPSEQEARDHTMGWRHFMGVLAAMASHEELGSLAESAVESYINAWNDTDSATRAKHIERCWEERATYRDPMSYIEGRDHLRDHIGSAQMFAPGARVEKTSGVDQCQGAARFLWKIHGPGDKILATGACFGQLSLAGRFLSIVSFWDPPRQA
jgi:uncharacterized protein YndB with AHSA1/START domain